MPTELRPTMNASGASLHAAAIAVRRFGSAFAARHWWFTVGISVFALIAALLLLTPWIAPHDPAALDLRMRMVSPSPQHWLGTDHLGRDVLSRLLEGGRFSVSIVLVTLVLSVGIGTVLGALSARIGGLFDEALMRVVDLLLSFPEVVVALFLIAVLGPGYGTLVLALTITGWTPFARLSRGLALEVNARDYIAAAEVLGCRRRFIVLRHLIPNLARPIAAITLPAIRTQADHGRRPVLPGPRRPASRLRLGRDARGRAAVHGARAAARDRSGSDHLPDRAERDDGRAGAGDLRRSADGDGGGEAPARRAAGAGGPMTKADPTAEPISRTTLSGQITERLRDGILAGLYSQGDQLNEAELARRFGVSRGPLREAMQRLIQVGLLENRPHRGVFVPELTDEDLADIYFAREAIETAALGRIMAEGEAAFRIAKADGGDRPDGRRAAPR